MESGSKYVLVKGAGDLATGTIRRLFLAGFKVVATEVQDPLVVRREVAFAEAVRRGEVTVEGVTAVMSDIESFRPDMDCGVVPVLVDPEALVMGSLQFDCLVDARMMKRENDTSIADAPAVIGLGPGFEAGKNCHAVIETLAGENLGRVIYSGKPTPNTGRPTNLDLAVPSPCSGGFDINMYVFFAEKDGQFKTERKIGEKVRPGETLGNVSGMAIRARAEGVLRGLLAYGVGVNIGTKLVEIDPTGDKDRCYLISAKANAVGGGVLEAIFTILSK